MCNQKRSVGDNGRQLLVGRRRGGGGGRRGKWRTVGKDSMGCEEKLERLETHRPHSRETRE